MLSGRRSGFFFAPVSRSIPMDDLRFDRITRAFGARTARRSMLKGMLGLGAVSALSRQTLDEASAARRGYSGPPNPPTLLICPSGGLPCNGGCCATGQICLGSEGCVTLNCTKNDDCGVCQCTSQTAIRCGVCAQLTRQGGICIQPYTQECDGCCQTVDNTGVCVAGCAP